LPARLGKCSSTGNGITHLAEVDLTIEYDSSSVASPAIYELHELWRYRDLLKLLVSNSIKTRYKRSSLGVVWTLLNPLLSTLVLTVALSQLMRFQIENYPVYLLTGLITWNFLSQITHTAMNNLVWGSSLLKRIYIPRTIFALSVLGNGIINLGLSLIPLILIMFVMGQPITWTFLLLPFAILLLAMFTLGLSLFLSTIAVYFVDMVEIFRVLTQAWFYLTPIIYPFEFVPPWFQSFLILNPMTWMVSIFRSLIFLGELPSLQVVVVATAVSVFTLLIGWWLFTRKADEFAYRI
jgi:ABC-type polysaccharide/polyol phosphate export permease